jgi:hypothetical protein
MTRWMKLFMNYIINRERPVAYESDNKSVLGSIVFVFVLVDEPNPGPVVSLSLCQTRKNSIKNKQNSNHHIDFS